MKTSIKSCAEPKSNMPKICDTFRYINEEVFMRINDEHGAKALSHGLPKKGKFYAVSLWTGEISEWEVPQNDPRFKLLRPSVRPLQFEELP